MDSTEFSPDCERVARQLADLREGRLEATQAEALRAHIDSCAQCSADATWDEQFPNLLRAASPAGPVNSIEERVRRRLRQRVIWRSGWRAAAAVVLAAGLFIWQVGPRFAHVNRSRPDSWLPAVAVNDLTESPVLFAAPPVASLDLLARQQAGVVAVIQELEQE